MRTHMANLAHLTAEYILPTFWLVHPLPPFAQVDGGGLLSRKIFSDFQTSISTRILFFYFFWFSFGFSDIRFSVKLVFRISFVLTHCKFSLDILLVWFRYIILDYNFGFCVFRFYISTRFLLVQFSSHQFRLVSALSILCFDSLSL